MSAGGQGGEPATPICGEHAGALPVTEAGDEWTFPVWLYRQDAVDAINLLLDSDGTWLVTVDGCDFGGCSSGYWEIDVDVLRLFEFDGQSFVWPGVAADEVFLTRQDTGVTAQVVWQAKETPENWGFGSICAECCGHLGPSATYACGAPDYDAALWKMCATSSP